MPPRTTQPQMVPAEAAKARQVEMILEGVEGLPTLSPVAARLLSVGSADEVDIEEITKIIESDPALASRVLGLCRRADKGLGDRITTVKRAVIMLGIEAVRSAALSVNVYDLINKDAREASNAESALFDRQGFWRFSLAVACACELIAADHMKGRVKPEEAFICGLLHGIGKPVLELVLPKAYTRVVALAERHASDSAPIERQIIGLDHHTAGKRVAEHWNLPELLREVIWLCGQPMRSLPASASKDLIALVTLARGVCRQLHLGWSGDYGPAGDLTLLCLDAGLADKMGRPTLKMEVFAEQLHRAVAARCKALGLEETTTPALLMEAITNANRQLAKVNVALEERSRQSQALAKVVAEVAAFHEAAASGQSLGDVLGAITKSAARVLGEGFFAVVYQGSPREDWQLHRFAPGSRSHRADIIEPPGADESARSLASLLDPSQLSVMAMGLLPGLADHLTGAADIRRLRIIPLVLVAEGQRAGPAAALVTERDGSGAGLNPPQLRALQTTWAAAVAGAARLEDTRRQGEDLVQLNRSLTEAQAKLTEAESLVKLGEVTAGAAHEMNNPLTVISGQSQLLAHRLQDAKDKASAERIAEAAQNLSDLVKSLHLISAPPRANPTPTVLREAIEQAISLAGKRLGAVPAAEIRVEGVPEAVRLDPSLFAQALAELIANAHEADAAHPIVIRGEVDALEGQLLVHVIDQGPGLSPKARQHAFDAFFSERPAGRGRGLGLPRAKSLAEAWGGEVTLHSVPGKAGTTATLVVPSWEAESSG